MESHIMKILCWNKIVIKKKNDRSAFIMSLITANYNLGFENKTTIEGKTHKGVVISQITTRDLESKTIP